MKIYTEISLKDFEAWSGAEYTMQILEQLEEATDTNIFDTLEACMEEFSNDWSDTAVNDFLWFENNTIAEWLGYKDWETLARVANKEEEEEEEIELEFSVGDVVKYNRYECKIVEIDRSDKELPYRVEFVEFGSIYWDWASADEVTEWGREE